MCEIEAGAHLVIRFFLGQVAVSRTRNSSTSAETTMAGQQTPSRSPLQTSS